ncbi:MAG: hypothetical protein ACR2RA_18980, partial [Geminicoccaceae bacterium]
TQPRLMAALEAVALDDLANSTITDGVIRPRALERWLNKRGPALSHLPDTQRKIMDIASAVTDVEGRFQTGQQLVRDRKVQAGQQAAAQRQQLDQTMKPLLERMGTLNERKMALEDTMLSRRITSLQRGTQTPSAVVSEAVRNPALMKKLDQQLAPYPDARKSLQRHVWNDLTSLDGGSLLAFLDEHNDSLSMIFGKKHLNHLGQLADGLRMLETVPPPTSAQPIRADALSRVEAATGLKPAQIASRYLGVTRGRSSRFVESFDTFARWLAARNATGVETLMKEALYNTNVARDLVNSFSTRRVDSLSTAERIATKRLRAWLWRLGITAPIESAQNTTTEREERFPSLSGG